MFLPLRLESGLVRLRRKGTSALSKRIVLKLDADGGGEIKNDATRDE
jgi:hypothetical protein